MINLSSFSRLFQRDGHRQEHRKDYNLKELEQLEQGKRSADTVEVDQPAEERAGIDAAALETELRKTIEGEVRFDIGSRSLYATDASNYRMVPIGVVIPKTKRDIIDTVRLCREYGAPLLSRGGGTSLAGQTCNVAVVMDMSKYYNNILRIDPDAKTARIQPGVVLDTLRQAAEQYTLTFGPDPATHNRCTLGGMMGNDSCGVHALMAGKTVDNVVSMEVLTYDGEIFEVGETSEVELEKIILSGGRRGEIYQQLKEIRDNCGDLIRKEYPKIPRRVSGYNLDDLLPESNFNVAKALVGTEGTCVVILEATVRLVYSPPGRSLVVLGYKNIFEAGDHILDILRFKPIGLEALDAYLVEYMKRKNLHPRDVQLLPDGGGWLIVEFGGADKQESDEKAKAMMAALRSVNEPPTMKLYDDPVVEHLIWLVRESGLGATARVPLEPDTWPGWEDSAVAPKNLGPYLRELQALFDKYHYKGVALYGHFGQGCVHCRIPFRLTTEEGIEEYRRFLTEAAHLVVKYGGSLSGEHGDGQARAALLPIMYSSQIIDAFVKFKRAWDPEWKMNPGKKVLPYPITADLRYGVNYEPWNPETYFQYPEDNHTLSRAVSRCVGVGECRRHDGGTMCPSYMATREEKHSTRGRARLLFEMLEGNPLEGGWQNHDVREALDLCLACKGCKSDCPVNVDMATYKAEFLAHYYSNRLRPRNAYAFGLIHVWARAAALAPWLVNFFTQTPGLRALAKYGAGMSAERSIPVFADETFKQWWKRRPPANIGNPLVILWPDTFNDHFHPNTAQAAVEVLESAGFQVFVPMQNMCCGRPLYDYGFLGLARSWLENILQNLRPYIRAGVPLVGLEPSCLAVFRDELIQLFPNDQDARRLSEQSFLLSEFLLNHAKDYTPPQMKAKAIVQGHCHHKSVMTMGDEFTLLRNMGVEFETPEVGCCGMAGAFGFEAGTHYEVSQTLADRHLVPAVKDAAADTLIIANGFSCRQQISQNTERQGLHLAEVLKLASDVESGKTTTTSYPERQLAPASKQVSTRVKVGAAIGISLLAAGFVFSVVRNRRSA